MPVWPYEHGEFRYCPQCGDVWRVARRGQTNPKTGEYRPGVVAERRTRCTCGNASPRLKPRLIPMRDQEAAEAAFKIGGDEAVRALVPNRKRPQTPDRRGWQEQSSQRYRQR